jgi:uncharacterized membrane protein YdbT with pleckstrin-like domain
MSGRGLVSVRLPESMLSRLRLAAHRQGVSANSFARTVVDGLAGLSGSQINEIPEPPVEAANPRLSVYLGQDRVEVLNAAATSSGISPSSALRKALHAALTRNLIPSVQTEEDNVSAAPLVVGIVLLAIFALIALIKWARAASERQKGKL